MDRRERRRAAAINKIDARLDQLAEAGTPEWLPMPYDGAGSDTLKLEEWAEYKARQVRHRENFGDYDTGWKRPSAQTAEAVWELLAPTLGLEVEKLAPPSYLRCLATPDDWRSLAQMTKQALLVVFDHFLTMANAGRLVTFNSVFAVLAERWSDHYRAARRSLPVRARDMKVETLNASRRDLLRNGLSLGNLWKAATAKNPLYEPTLVESIGYQVDTNKGSPDVLRQFQARIVGDPAYQGFATEPHRLLLAGEPLPKRPTRYEICAERPYNVVKIGHRSERLLEAQERARIFFDIGAFLEEYRSMETSARQLEHRLREEYKVNASLSDYWPGRWFVVRKAKVGKGGRKQQVQSKRERHLWKISNSIPPDRRGEWWRTVRSLLEQYDEIEDHRRKFQEIYNQTRGLASSLAGARYVMIKSRFTRVVNRRYQAENFWPSEVSGDQERRAGELLSQSLRERWFKLPLDRKAARDREGTLGDQSWHDVPDDAFPVPVEFVEVDVSSSQTQILAVFLGLENLERVAGSPKKPFKKYLAEKAWELHQNQRILNDSDETISGYTGPDDSRLVALVKELWLRVLYGGKIRQVVHDQYSHRRIFGPGWRHRDSSTRAEYSKALDDGEIQALKFLVSLEDYRHVERFLHACQLIAKRVDRFEGVVFIDPFDGAEVRWNPVRRRIKKIPVGHNRLIVSVPTGQPNEAGDYPIDRQELGRMIAPCLTHMMDASFSSLAMERFLEHGVRDFVAIHDSWIVPAFVPAPTRSKVLEDDREQEWQDKQDRSGPALLRAAIKSAGEEWLRSLGPVYDRLLHYLAGTEFEADVRSWKDQWERRRREARWPQFTALPPEREVLTGPSRTPLKTRF